VPARERRSDATANRDRIVEVARAELSAANGAVDELRLHRVAKAAGVGQGTFYRHFPTREHLLAEVYREELTQLVELVGPLLEAHPPLEALGRWLDRLVEYARVKRGVLAAIEASAWQDLWAEQHHRLDAALDTLLQRGRAAGEIRGGVDATDAILLLGALSRIPDTEWDRRAPVVVQVVLAGLRPPSPPAP
jgi:AcrR family transcriptional regulator